jgi:8-oxo-dGTP pyrophosphatase MutT (NUDIX family)
LTFIEGLSARLRAARDFQPRRFVRLEFGTDTIGWIRRDLAGRLRAWPRVFEFSEKNICLRPAAEAVLSAALAEVAQGLARAGAVRGWRGESYAIRAGDGAAVLFHLERAAMRFFGLTSSAAHLNGFVETEAGARILVARRAPTKAIDPGMLDNLVAGGIPSGQDAWQTLLRECGEEAGIPVALAAKALPAGVLQVYREVPEGLHSEILFIHDLALPAAIAPRNTDGEVSEFLSLDAASLIECVARGEMTVEAGLVAVDFVLRHGLLQDEDGKIGAAIEACRRFTLL